MLKLIYGVLKMKNKIIKIGLSISLLSVSAFASFSDKQVDDMIKKLNYKENTVIYTDIKDPFGYPEKEEKQIKKRIKKQKALKSIKKKKKELKKIIINYQGIIIDKALINNKTYKKGNYFEDAKIVNFTDKELFLQQNDFIFAVEKGNSKIMIKEQKNEK